MSLGPVMLDIASTQLSSEDKARLLHPLTGGVILFTRNYDSVEQLTALTAEIHAFRTPPLLIAVDHEGGRVQRFRKDFTRCPRCASWERYGTGIPTRRVIWHSKPDMCWQLNYLHAVLI